MGGTGGPEHLIVKGKRLDGRKLDELRPISIQVGVVPNADGSCKLSLGDTEVIAAVYGPGEMFPRHLKESDRAHLKCVYSMASFATPERGRAAPSRRSKEISRVMTDALKPAIMLEKYPKTGIEIFTLVSNANAGTRCAAISAAAVALADAGIQMRDLVASVASGKADGKILLDLFNPEDNFGEADLPLAILPKSREVTLLQMDGHFTKEEFKQATELAIKGCEEVYKKQKAALKEKYKEEGKNGK